VAAREAAAGRSSARDLLWYDGRGAATDFAALPLDSRYQATHLAFFRSAWNDKSALYVGFKGGDNAANHAHLDLGTFVLDALGQRWAVDLGPDDYDLPGYFGPEGGYAIADLTAAYAGSGATRVHRGIALRDNRARVLVQDEIETSKPVGL